MLVGDLEVTQTSPEAATGLAVENLCPQLVAKETLSAAEIGLRDRCGDLVFDGSPQTLNLRQVATEEMASQETAIVELSANQLNGIGARLEALRSSIRTSVQQVSLKEDQSRALALRLNGFDYGGGAGDGIADSGRLGLFVNANLARGDKDQTANESGFDVDVVSLTLGADYRLGRMHSLAGQWVSMRLIRKWTIKEATSNQTG
jgi:hypothetical protein